MTVDIYKGPNKTIIDSDILHKTVLIELPYTAILIFIWNDPLLGITFLLYFLLDGHGLSHLEKLTKKEMFFFTFII